MIYDTVKEVLEQAKDNDGNISVSNFTHLYDYDYYRVEGKVLLGDILMGARMMMGDIKLPMNDINNLLELVEGVDNG